MSRELEMLRGALDSSGTCAVFAKTDLRAILRRLEAAERVVESLGRSDWGRNIADQSGIGDAYDTYRALDGEETK